MIDEADEPPAPQTGVVVSAPSASVPGTWLRFARKRVGVRLRRESYGALAYVPELDRFTALDHQVARFVGSLGRKKTAVSDDQWLLVSELAAAGILDSWPATTLR